nr:B-cell scaffold protein with ankyrin repeats-like isoform X1 [Gasterosteus aculeatus aculeatus]
MSQTAEQLLIIYEKESEQWAAYLHAVFSGPIPEAGICLYDMSTLSSRQDDFLWLARYTCKLLILSDGMLEGLCPKRRFFLARVLRPAAHVVVLLCGVESLTPLLELVPLNANECLQVSSEQDAHEYLTTVTDIVRKAAKAKPLSRQPLGPKVEEMREKSVKSSMAVVPSRVACRSSTEVFILLKNESAGSDAEVEFAGEKRMLRVKPEFWNERILCVNAPDFTAGNVTVTLYSGGLPLSKAQVQYYSNVQEMTTLLARAANPVDFMCQAFQESTLENLDQRLSSMLLAGMPGGGFQGLHCEKTPGRELRCTDAPSLLHFAAQYGFRSVSCLLLQCPGVERALHTANRHGETPAEIAKSQGHTELHILLKEALNMFSTGGDNDAGVYEMMGSAGTPTATHLQRERQGEHEEVEVEDAYPQLEVKDVYDTIQNSPKAAVIASRPPAPTPRPENMHASEEEDRTPYITKVFQKKTPQRDADLYSVTTKQIQGRVNSPPSTYDTFVPNRTSGQQQLIELQQRVKAGSLSVDGAVKHFGEWQRTQKAMDAGQKEKSSQQKARFVGSAEHDDSVFDKINIVHLGPSVEGNEGRRGSQANESDGVSKPLKGQRVSLLNTLS